VIAIGPVTPETAGTVDRRQVAKRLNRRFDATQRRATSPTPSITAFTFARRKTARATPDLSCKRREITVAKVRGRAGRDGANNAEAGSSERLAASDSASRLERAEGAKTSREASGENDADVCDSAT